MLKANPKNNGAPIEKPIWKDDDQMIRKLYGLK